MNNTLLGIPPTPLEMMVEMNNHGVQLLGSGNFYLARQAFYKATDMMHEVMHQQQGQDRAHMQGPFGPQNDNGSCTLSLSDPPMLPQRTQVAYSGSSADHCPVPSSSSPLPNGANHGNSSPYATRMTATTTATATSRCDQGFDDTTPLHNDPNALYSFLRPVLFSQDDFAQAKNPPLLQISVCLLFNLAVANHTIALSMGNNNININNMNNCNGDDMMVCEDNTTSFDQLIGIPLYRNSALEEAIYMYQLAYGLQLDGGIEVSWLHTLGMINNVGRLHAFAQNVKEAEGCFQNLLKLLMMEQQTRRKSCRLNATGGNSNNASTSHDVYTELFLDNVFRVVLCNDQMASPAA